MSSTDDASSAQGDHKRACSATAEIDRLADFLMRWAPHQIGVGNPRGGESAVDVAIRLIKERGEVPVIRVANPLLPGTSLFTVSMMPDSARAYMAGRGYERARTLALIHEQMKDGCDHSRSKLDQLAVGINAEKLNTRPPAEPEPQVDVAERVAAARSEAVEAIIRELRESLGPWPPAAEMEWERGVEKARKAVLAAGGRSQ